MRLITKVAVGGSLATAATVTGLLVSGVFAGSVLVVADPLAPSARADGLLAFDDCDALLDWYVDRALEDVGPYGWDDDVIAYGTDLRGMTDGLSPMAGAAEDSVVMQRSAKSLSQSNSETGTNTQEADVDEPDSAKTDGRRVVRLIGNSTLAITDVTGRTPRELSRVTLPGKEFYGAELLLVGDHVLALASDGDRWVRPGFPRPLGGPGTVVDDGIARKAPVGATKVFDVDISDPTRPRLAHVDRYTGRLVSARQYGDTVRLVTATGRPDLPWYFPGRGISEAEAARRNEALVRATTVDDWLPAVRTSGRTTPLLDCADVLHPHTWAGSDTVAVTTFTGDAVGDRTSIGITADAQVAYSSGDRLYVASAQLPGDDPFDDERLGEPLVLRNAITRTDLHAFALDGTDTTYVASGTIAGDVRDRWSLDEYDGVLRVAWTRLSTRDRARNGIITMTERDGHLVRIGEIRGLGVNEQIQAVRWFDDVALLVTFRQVDPLYTIDLTDPADPIARGALKIPGYSGYLHPLGDDRLLGLGVDATTAGRTLGAQAATFDITDLTAPRRTGQVGFGSATHLPAIEDPRGFTWLPDLRTGVTAVRDWRTGSRLIALHVEKDGTLGVQSLAHVSSGWQTRTLPLDDGRIAVIESDNGDKLRVLDLG